MNQLRNNVPQAGLNKVQISGHTAQSNLSKRNSLLAQNLIVPITHVAVLSHTATGSEYVELSMKLSIPKQNMAEYIFQK